MVPMPGPRHDHAEGQISSQAAPEQHRLAGCSEQSSSLQRAASRLVDVLAFACAIIQEYDKPLDDMHCILLDASGCISRSAGHH